MKIAENKRDITSNFVLIKMTEIKKAIHKLANCWDKIFVNVEMLRTLRLLF